MVRVVGLVLAVALTASGCGSSSPQPPDQAKFQADVVDDRKDLFDGQLSYQSRVSAPVDSAITYQITLKALSDEVSDRSAPDQPAVETRSFQVGGAQGASLTSADREVQVRLLTDSRARQVIAEPKDTAQWQWSVSASDPGDYELVLVLTTYQLDSDRALCTLTPPLTVRLSVSNTLSHRIDSLLRMLLAWGGVAVALTAIIAFRAPLAAFVRARREAWRERKRGEDGYL